MEFAIRKLRIHDLKARLEGIQFDCEPLIADLEAATTVKAKSEINLQWRRAMQKHHTVLLALTRLERQDREAATR